MSKHLPSVWSENPLVKYSANHTQYIINLRREIERLRMERELNPMTVVEVLEIVLTLLQKATSMMPMKSSVRLDIEGMTSLGNNALYHSTHLRPSHD